MQEQVQPQAPSDALKFPTRHGNDIRDHYGKVLVPFCRAKLAWALPGRKLTKNRLEADRVAWGIYDYTNAYRSGQSVEA